MITYNGFQIKPYPQAPRTYTVATEGRGGKIPNVLTGLFTSPGEAKQVIDLYLETKVEKDTENGKKVSKS